TFGGVLYGDAFYDAEVLGVAEEVRLGDGELVGERVEDSAVAALDAREQHGRARHVEAFRDTSEAALERVGARRAEREPEAMVDGPLERSAQRSARVALHASRSRSACSARSSSSADSTVSR